MIYLNCCRIFKYYLQFLDNEIFHLIFNDCLHYIKFRIQHRMSINYLFKTSYGKVNICVHLLTIECLGTTLNKWRYECLGTIVYMTLTCCWLYTKNSHSCWLLHSAILFNLFVYIHQLIIFYIGIMNINRWNNLYTKQKLKYEKRFIDFLYLFQISIWIKFKI